MHCLVKQPASFLVVNSIRLATRFNSCYCGIEDIKEFCKLSVFLVALEDKILANNNHTYSQAWIWGELIGGKWTFFGMASATGAMPVRVDHWEKFQKILLKIVEIGPFWCSVTISNL